MKLYPLRFNPIFKEKTWGGQLLLPLAGAAPNYAGQTIGEQWLLSGLEGDETTVSNGFLEENSITDLAEVYMEELMGEQVYRRFGGEFPLMIRLLDSSSNSPLMVHPDDDTAAERHHAYGRRKMWYVMEASPNAYCYVGFKATCSAQQLTEHLANGKIEKLLHRQPVQQGDALLIEPGTVHALGAGVLVAEIGQASDIAYQLYDWGQEEPDRDIFVELALDVIQYHPSPKNIKVAARIEPDMPQTLFNTHSFAANSLRITLPTVRQLSLADSFVTYLCIAGQATVRTTNGSETLQAGQVLVIPASVQDEGITLLPTQATHVLEILVMPIK